MKSRMSWLALGLAVVALATTPSLARTVKHKATNGASTYAQQVLPSGQCWIPTRGFIQSGSNPNGTFGYYGPCNLRHARRAH